MDVTTKGELALLNSGEVNTLLRGARDTDEESLADLLSSSFIWTTTPEGRMTKTLYVPPEYRSKAEELLRGMASGRIAVHETYIETAREMLTGCDSALE